MKFGETYDSCDIQQPFTADANLTDRMAVVFGSSDKHVTAPTYRGQQCAGLVFSEGVEGYSSGDTRVALFRRGTVSFTAGETLAQGDYLSIYAANGRLGKWQPGDACVGVALRAASGAGKECLCYFDVAFQTPAGGPIVIPTGAMTADTEVTTGAPAGNYIVRVIYAGGNANAVTGGLDIGTTASGEEVMSQQTCAGNTKYDAIYGGSGANVVAPYFALTANDSLYITAHTAWNSASVTAWIILTLLP